MNAPKFLARMSLESDLGATLSDTRIRLLEAIDVHGSINRAAKAVPLSYKAAWDAIDTLNNLAPEPLVLRTSAGRQGGGTQLTDYGRKLVAMYRALEAQYQAALDTVSAQLAQSGDFDAQAFKHTIERMSMKCSARNQFYGSVFALRECSAADYQVALRLNDGSEINATITRASAENLGLHMGAEVLAMVKAPAVAIGTNADSPREGENLLWGHVSHIEEGPLNHEVTLELASGRTITAAVSRAQCQAMHLVVGSHACASFAASSVLLATFH